MTTLEEVQKRAESDAKTYGYYLNPDPEFLKGLIEGLKKNWDRYGYPSCPCRLASGNIEIDRDIICPCDYRDPDVAEYGQCYCSLYVSKEVYEGKAPLRSIPERRPKEKQIRSFEAAKAPTKKEKAEEEAKLEAEKPFTIKKKLWYCKQCGYVVYREDPPYICPICKAKREMFSEISITISEKG
ncbi:MAG: ferredoxin-thioredoxin reductase catalytic domain-containing protein [Candidatus Freyarchaeota archaeon]